MIAETKTNAAIPIVTPATMRSDCVRPSRKNRQAS